MTHPSDIPETGLLQARMPPPRPPAPPTTGEGGGSEAQGGSRGGWWFAIGVRQLLALSLITVGLAAWLVSLPGILGGIAASSPAVLLAPRFRFLQFTLLYGVVAALVGAVGGSVIFGHGTLLSRVLAGGLVAFVIMPSVIALTSYRFVRALHARASA